MAGELSYTEIKTLIDAYIKVNRNREITPPLHNIIETALANSNLNKKDGGVLEQLAYYSSALTITDPLSLVYKSWVEDQITDPVWGTITGTITDQTDLITLLSGYLTQGSNVLTEALIFDGNSLYDLNVIDGNIDLNGGWLIDPSLIRYMGSTVWDIPNMVIRNNIDGNIGVDINNSRLSSGGSVKFQWDSGLFYNNSGQAVADFNNKALQNFNGSSNVDVIEWMLGLANDFSGDPSFNWFDRILFEDWAADSGKFVLIKTPGTTAETNGNWRIGIDGDDFVIQRRESGTWNIKFAQTP